MEFSKGLQKDSTISKRVIHFDVDNYFTINQRWDYHSLFIQYRKCLQEADLVVIRSKYATEDIITNLAKLMLKN